MSANEQSITNSMRLEMKMKKQIKLISQSQQNGEKVV